MSEKTTEPDGRKGLPADYRGATPGQVALAVLRYRPEQRERSREAGSESRPATGMAAI